jgi:hypothetical protein
MRRFLPIHPLVQAALIFLLALAPRLHSVRGQGKLGERSHVEVERAALTWAREGRLANAFGDNTGPTAHVPPLYTGLLAALHCVFGPDSPAAFAAQRLLSIVICSFGIALLPWLGRRCGLSNAAGVIGAVFLAISPMHLFIEVHGRQETVYAVLLNMGLLALWLRLRESGWQEKRQVVLLAVLTGIAALTAPQLIVFVGLALLADLVFCKADRTRVLRAGAIVAGISALMIAPWVVRNYVELGGFVPLRSNLGLELFIGNNPDSDGHTYTIPYSHPNDPLAWPHPFNNPLERQHLHDVGELAYMKEKGELAKTWIREHPGAFARLTVQRLVFYWFPPVSHWNPALSARWMRSLLAWGLSIVSLAGLFLLFLRKHSQRWTLTLALFAPSLVYMFTHVNVRYRYASVWMMALLAGHALVTMCHRNWITSSPSLSLPAPPSAEPGAGYRREPSRLHPSCSRDSAIPA